MSKTSGKTTSKSDLSIEPMELRSYRDVVFNEAGELFSRDDVLEESFQSPFSFEKRDRSRFERKCQRAWDNPVKMSGGGLWATDRLSYFYFHWLCDVLPRLEALYLEKPSVMQPMIIPRRVFERSFVNESLAAWPQLLVARQLAEGQSGLPERLTLISRSAEAPLVHDALIRSVSERLKRLALSPGKATRRIYVSRKSARVRRVENEDDIRPVLENYGFEITEMEKLPLGDQIALMRETMLLAGPHGGGLTNMMFMPRGAKILELRKADGPPPCYANLAAALDHEWLPFACEASDQEEHPHAAHILADARGLDEALARLTTK